uniref:predicted GPI-anchored protein 58 n=1 Tax=Odobenus rosmarus divergens TaxID=9708 RepID=UPI00063CA3AD|nr:PREDICTED: predicted GPI-anchored protein 58 [Odobenus rosmarus divergens]
MSGIFFLITIIIFIIFIAVVLFITTTITMIIVTISIITTTITNAITVITSIITIFFLITNGARLPPGKGWLLRFPSSSPARAHTSSKPRAPATPLQVPRPALRGRRLRAPSALRPRARSHPLTWRRCRRARAPRAHPPGGPEVRARSRMAARAPAESSALARRGRPRRALTPLPWRGRAGMPPGPLRLEVPGEVRPRRPERAQPAPPSPLYRQKSDAWNKSRASERTVPGRPSI